MVKSYQNSDHQSWFDFAFNNIVSYNRCEMLYFRALAIVIVILKLLIAVYEHCIMKLCRHFERVRSK